MEKFVSDSRTLPDLLFDVAQRVPDREAVVFEETRLTYAALHAKSRAFAAGLMSLGVEHGEKVAILMGNRTEWIISALAVTSLGAVAVGINTWSTGAELEYFLNHSDTKVLIAAPHYLKKDFGSIIDELRAAGKLPKLEHAIAVDAQDAPEGWFAFDQLYAQTGDTEFGDVMVTSGDVALLIYTSGSTSKPKGVQLLHGDLIASGQGIGERQGASQYDRLWLAVSLFWGFGCSNAWPNMLSHGGCIVLQENFDAAEALSLIAQERCTLFYGTPNMAQALLDHPDRASHDLSSLRSGATLGTPKQVKRVVDLGATEICNVYGLTEIYGNSHVTHHKDPLEQRLNSVGQALPNVSTRIVDPVTGADCPTDVTGEIRLAGYVTPGYYKDPSATAAAFDELKYFKTGDLGFLDHDGYLHFRGRIKEVVKTGGILVSPAEIETTIMDHPTVNLAFVVGVPDARRDEVLGAIIITDPSTTVSEQELVAFCKERLATYKVPRCFAFCGESDLPLTTTGKVQRNRLVDTFFADSFADDA